MSLSASNILLQQQILLESGTNELEVLVFRLAHHAFGVNVAKVRSVIPMAEITPLHGAHPSVLGVFRLRDVVMPCVSLARHLVIAEPTKESTVLVTELNQQQLAFAIDSVERIHRLSWEKILPLPPLAEFSKAPVTAIANIANKIVLMLDLESIHSRISDQLHDPTAVPNPNEVPRESKRLIVAEDSPTVRNAVRQTLKESGYVNVRMFENGLEAWNFIEQATQGGTWQAAGDLLVTDIEMPQMDGLHLTKKIKDSPSLKGLPVLLYSSIVTADNTKKGKAVGADAQIAKTELHQIVEWADKLTGQASPRSNPSLQPSGPQAVPSGPASIPAKPAVAPAAQPAPIPTMSMRSVAPVSSPSSPAANRHVEPCRVESPDEPVDASLWRSFRAEMGDRVQALNDGIERQGKSDPVDVATQFYRVVHSIKSAASVIPLPELVAAAHQLEDRLGQARSKQCDVPWDWVSEFADWLARLMGSDDPSQFMAANPGPSGAAR